MAVLGIESLNALSVNHECCLDVHGDTGGGEYKWIDAVNILLSCGIM